MGTALKVKVDFSGGVCTVQTRGKAHADEWRGRKVELGTATMALAHPACREATNPSEC
jgi:hypothetical protein